MDIRMELTTEANFAIRQAKRALLVLVNGKLKDYEVLSEAVLLLEQALGKVHQFEERS